jgi:hypothetical protein
MDISTLRLGLAHSALRQALGDEMYPISFAQGSFAFIDRQSGDHFFCCAESSSLPIMSIDPSGKLGDGSDESSKALRAHAEPIYLAALSSFARDFDRASSNEERARTQDEPARTQSMVESPGPAKTRTVQAIKAVQSIKSSQTAKPVQATHVVELSPAAERIVAPRQPTPMPRHAEPPQPRALSDGPATLRRAPRASMANPSADRV